MNKFNRRIVYFYLLYTFFIPVYIMYLGNIKDYDLAHDLALYGGYRFSFLGGFTISTFLFMVLVLNIILSKRKIKLSQLKEYRYLKIMVLYSVLLIIINLFQSLFYGIDILLLIKKPLKLLLFPVLLFNFFYFFADKDKKKLLKFLYYCLSILVIMFLIFKVIPYLSTLSGFNVNKRLSGFVYHGQNGSAAILSLILILYLYKYSSFKLPHNKIKYFVISIFILTLIVFTFTRAVLFALALTLILYLILSKKLESKLIIVIFLLIIVGIFGYNQVQTIFLRGESVKILSDFSSAKESTLANRINVYWLPTIYYTFTNPSNLLLGSEFRGFNDYLYNITGVYRANHNIFIQLLALYGIIPTIIFFLFWIKILWDIFNKLLIFNKINNRKLIMSLGFIVFIYFTCFNFMNITTPLFENTMAIVLFVLFKTLYPSYKKVVNEKTCIYS